jgi:endonuclease/exonuclease/phosphatase family metal-dependent hydrolase
LLEEAITRRNADHVVVMGDFNYPSIDYDKGEVNTGLESDASKFNYKMLDLTMYQQLTEMTRIRQGQHPSMLDYVFTDEQNRVELIHYEVPLGKSDHICLQWAIKKERPTCWKETKKTKLLEGQLCRNQ